MILKCHIKYKNDYVRHLFKESLMNHLGDDYGSTILNLILNFNMII